MFLLLLSPIKYLCMYKEIKYHALLKKPNLRYWTPEQLGWTVSWGGQNTGQYASNSYNGQIATGYTRQISSHSYRYNGQSSIAAYSHNGQIANGQGWVIGYSGYGQPAPPGYMNRPPTYGKHKKVETVMNICLLGVFRGEGPSRDR
jgi:hypothetical protein